MQHRFWKFLAFVAFVSAGALRGHAQTSINTDFQGDIMLTQNWAMPTLINPAATGNIDFIRIRGAARLEFLGSRNSPKNFIGAADSPFKLLGKRIGAGVVAYSSTYGYFDNLLVGAQGSFKFNVKKSNFSIGIQLGYYHTKFKGSELRLSDITGGNTATPDDNNPDLPEYPDSPENSDNSDNTDIPDSSAPDANELPTQDVKAGAFDISLGLRYEHPKFYIGISGQHLTSPKLKLTTDGETSTDTRFVESKLPATLYFDAGGNIGINNSLFTLQPSLLVGTDFSDVSAVVEMRATYNNRFTFGVDYRYNRAAGLVAGVILKNFYVGYSWEYDYSGHPRGSTGNHELVIGYQFKLDMGGKNTFAQRSIRIM